MRWWRPGLSSLMPSGKTAQRHTLSGVLQKQLLHHLHHWITYTNYIYTGPPPSPNFVRQQHKSGLGRHIVEVSRTHSIRHTYPAVLQRTRDQFFAEADTDIKHNKLKRRTIMLPAEFELVIPAIEQPHFYVLYCSRTLYGLTICSSRGTFMQIRNKNHLKKSETSYGGGVQWLREGALLSHCSGGAPSELHMEKGKDPFP